MHNLSEEHQTGEDCEIDYYKLLWGREPLERRGFFSGLRALRRDLKQGRFPCLADGSLRSALRALRGHYLRECEVKGHGDLSPIVDLIHEDGLYLWIDALKNREEARGVNRRFRYEIPRSLDEEMNSMIFHPLGVLAIPLRESQRLREKMLERISSRCRRQVSHDLEVAKSLSEGDILTLNRRTFLQGLLKYLQTAESLGCDMSDMRVEVVQMLQRALIQEISSLERRLHHDYPAPLQPDYFTRRLKECRGLLSGMVS